MNDTKTFQALFQQGFWFLERKKIAESEITFRKACEIKPDSELAWFFFVLCFK